MNDVRHQSVVGNKAIPLHTQIDGDDTQKPQGSRIMRRIQHNDLVKMMHRKKIPASVSPAANGACPSEQEIDKKEENEPTIDAIEVIGLLTVFADPAKVVFLHEGQDLFLEEGKLIGSPLIGKILAAEEMREGLLCRILFVWKMFANDVLHHFKHAVFFGEIEVAIDAAAIDHVVAVLGKRGKQFGDALLFRRTLKLGGRGKILEGDLQRSVVVLVGDGEAMRLNAFNGIVGLNDCRSLPEKHIAHRHAKVGHLIEIQGVKKQQNIVDDGDSNEEDFVYELSDASLSGRLIPEFLKGSIFHIVFLADCRGQEPVASQQNQVNTFLMNVRKKGLFCVVEGMDGAGKTTALQVLSDWLQGRAAVLEEARSAVALLRKHTVVFLREPTSLETGLEIRRRLSSDEPTEFREWIRLFRADREANLQTFVRPSLFRGEIVVQDRYLYSTAAYQGAFADIGPKGVLAEFADFPRPDLLIFLEIDEKTAFARMQARAGDREVFERPDRWRRIRDAYREILPANSMIIDAALPVQEVAGRMAVTLAKAGVD